MKDEKNKQFTLSDFYLSAFLKVKNFNLLDVIKTNPQRVVFVFEDRNDREKLVEDYLFGRSEVEPKSYVSAIKELKQLIHSGYESSFSLD